ncbi:MAG: phosphatase PAP2 family protein [Gammaproteobacteria bacterium]
MTEQPSNLAGRLRGKDYLPLLWAAGVFILATLLFTAIAGNVIGDTWLTLMDKKISAWLHAQASPPVTTAMLVITHIHRPLGIGLMAGICAPILLWQRRWYWLCALILAVPGGLILNLVMKDIFARARPVFMDPLLTLTTYSFPSGHALGSTVFYGVLVAFVFGNVRARHWRLLALIFATLMILLVAFSRVYLGVHYMSDVFAAIMEGLAWLAVCFIAVNSFWRCRNRRF